MNAYQGDNGRSLTHACSMMGTSTIVLILYKIPSKEQI